MKERVIGINIDMKHLVLDGLVFYATSLLKIEAKQYFMNIM